MRIVCAGPSLCPEDRAASPSLTFAPPVADGDIFRLVRNGAQVIGIVDGYFGDQLALQHKEILWAMAQGVCVAGAASIGALRASELCSYGMLGIGKIFHAYNKSILVDDAAVAVSHAPADLEYAPLSLAHVDVVTTFKSLGARGHLSNRDVDQLIEISSQIHFKDRNWALLGDAWGNSKAQAEQFTQLFKGAHVQAKRLDALELISWIETVDLSAKKQYQPYQPPVTPAFENAIRRSGITAA